ncbi:MULTISPECIES: hypothetical protein [unclassified Streptomyces]|uniref:hypothetical protein n=1 Tax=unclassified Streptomyces TaxID=2593676 RepID=UPI002E190EA3
MNSGTGTFDGGTRAPAFKDAIRLRRLSRQQAQDLREDLADLYVESTPGSVVERCRGRRDFLRRLAGDVRRPGFALVLAETTTVVGCAFGVPVGRRDLWWRGVDPAPQRSVARLTAAGQAFALTQVVADPHGQNRAIAHRLQQRLLTARHATLGLTLVHPADRAARAAFESWGWQDIGEVAAFPGPVVLRALVMPRGEPPQAGDAVRSSPRRPTRTAAATGTVPG